MSGTSGDFNHPGAKVGIEVWRIEKLHAVLQPAVDFKTHPLDLFSGDCYLILNTFDDKYGKRQMDLFYWLGSKSSQDEQGGVAYKAVELDDSLGGKPVQHREVEGHESAQFTSLFPKGIRYQSGGIESAFKKVDPSKYDPRLFQVKGKRNVRVQQVALAASSLNQGDVFILDLGLTLFQWNGSSANRYEKAKGLEFITKVNDEERGRKAKVVFLEHNEDDATFWNALGGKGRIKGADEVPSDDEVKDAVTQLFTSSGDLVAQGALDRSALQSDQVFLVDSGTQVFVWIGKATSKEARAQGMTLATAYLAKHGRPSWTPLTRVAESGEPPAFKALFKIWEPPKTVDMRAGGAAKAAAAPDTSALFQAQKQAEEKMASLNGQVTVWRIENFDKVELDKSMYGQFFAGDSYIVLFKYQVNGKDHGILYFWQGRNSSQDEKGSSALLTKNLSDTLPFPTSQVRVVMNKEPNHFLALFKGTMVVHEGGKAGAFKNRQEADSYSAGLTNLYHVRGTNAHNTHAVQVALAAASLNSGDCFVVTTPAEVFAWRGMGSSDDEKATASKVAGLLATGRPVHTLDEGAESDAFWAALGGKGEYSSSKELASGEHEARLFQCSNAGNGFKVTEIPNFSQDDLVNDDVMLLDAYGEVFVWIGHDSNKQERELSLEAALNYVKNAPDGRDPDTPVFVVQAGGEPPSFTCHFLGWDDKKASDFSDPYLKKLGAAKNSSGPGPAAAAGAAPAAKPAAVQRVTSLADSGLGYLDPSTHKFSYADLKNKTAANVDPTKREQYLSDAEFQQVLGMDRAAFEGLVQWKKDQAKKKAGIF